MSPDSSNRMVRRIAAYSPGTGLFTPSAAGAGTAVVVGATVVSTGTGMQLGATVVVVVEVVVLPAGGMAGPSAPRSGSATGLTSHGGSVVGGAAVVADVTGTAEGAVESAGATSAATDVDGADDDGAAGSSHVAWFVDCGGAAVVGLAGATVSVGAFHPVVGGAVGAGVAGGTVSSAGAAVTGRVSIVPSSAFCAYAVPAEVRVEIAIEPQVRLTVSTATATGGKLRILMRRLVLA